MHRSPPRPAATVKAADGSELDQDVWEQAGEKAESVIKSFRNSYDPRIVVTVDMIATGTDIRPLEIVMMFLRDIRGPNLSRATQYSSSGTSHTHRTVVRNLFLTGWCKRTAFSECPDDPPEAATFR